LKHTSLNYHFLNRDRPFVFFPIIYTAPTTAISLHRSPHRQSVKENLPVSQSNGDRPRGAARLRRKSGGQAAPTCSVQRSAHDTFAPIARRRAQNACRFAD